MCRVAGRRCEHNWTETQRQADLARRRAVYAEKKAARQQQLTQEGNPETANPDTSTLTGRHAEAVARTKKIFNSNIAYHSEHHAPDTVEMGHAKALAELCAEKPLSYLNVTGEDQAFAEKGKSLNVVSRLTLEDGTVGYWKEYKSNVGELSTIGEFFGHDPLATMNNEVAAYEFSKILGYEGLVPETVVRVVDTKIGSFQREAAGEPALIRLHRGFLQPMNRKELEPNVDREAFRKAAVFDYIIGSSDRHGGNIIRDGKEVTLIDNGFCFPGKRLSVVNDSVFIENLVPGQPRLTEEERERIQQLHNDPTVGGMDKYLHPEAITGMRRRMNELLQRETRDRYEFGEEPAEYDGKI